eukprot:TRINITY_DN1390_c0_g1_i1.p1 TRINITY_DN1390_c0_g1~~TRINITY_DN1390_c0_g1_i1.p1  ORF type:complete len:563 (-),score=107.36 TRINITY_DN1390_c0_g1_i1:166-1854(-)
MKAKISVGRILLSFSLLVIQLFAQYDLYEYRLKQLASGNPHFRLGFVPPETTASTNPPPSNTGKCRDPKAVMNAKGVCECQPGYEKIDPFKPSSICEESSMVQLWKACEAGGLYNVDAIKPLNLLDPRTMENLNISTPTPLHNITTNCSRVTLLGGLDAFSGGVDVNRFYAKLPPHFAVRVKGNAFTFGGMTPGDLQLRVNGKVQAEYVDYTRENHTKLCHDDKDDLWTFSKALLHDGRNLTWDFISTYPKDAKKSWGLAFLKFEFCRCHASCKACSKSPLNCTACADPNAEKQANGTCACKKGYYQDKIAWPFFVCRADEIKTVNASCQTAKKELIRLFSDQELLKQNYSAFVASGGNKIEQCGTQRVFGFFGNRSNVTGKLNQLKPHFALRIKTNVYLLDRFDNNVDNVNNENFNIMVDNKTVARWTPPWLKYSSRDLCGSKGWTDNSWRSTVVVPHSSVDAKLVFKDYSNNSLQDASWGLADTTIEICLCHNSCKTCTNGSQCVECADPKAFKGADGTCVCPPNMKLVSENPFKCGADTGATSIDAKPNQGALPPIQSV